MNTLTKKTCEACRVGAPHATDEERERYLPLIPDWKIVREDGIDKLERTYSFSNFAEALAFTNDIGALAESENHHPDLTTRYGSVTVVWYSHKIKGLHLNDFIMAAKSDLAYKGSS